MSNEKQKSDLSRAFSEDGALKTHVGGQALLEGIMMRGKLNWSVAVREPDGNIYTEEHDLASGKDKNGWLYWPFVRGCRAFVESLVLGYKALSIAAEHAFVEEDEGEDEKEKASRGGGAIADAEAPANAQSPVDAGAPANAQATAHGEAPTQGGFSWKRDFGNPDEMIDALGAQRVLDVIDGDTGLPVRLDAEETCDVLVATVEETPEYGDHDCHSERSEESTRSSLAENATIEDPSPSAQDDMPPAETRKAEDPSPSAQDDMPPAETRKAEDPSPSAQDGMLSAETPNKDAASDTADAAGTAGADAAAKESSGKKPMLGDKEMLLSMVLGLVLGIVLFVVAPAFVTNLIVGEYDGNTLLWNVVDGFLRIAVFIFYIWLIGRMSDIKRMFGYHGAEHKAIHCFEHGLPLTPENARSFPRLHVRCGTAFLIMVMIIAIFVYTVTPLNALIDAWGVPDGAPKLVLVIVVRILLMPVIAGVAYEITVKWAGSHPDNPLVKVVLWPGMQMQYLTTREPDDGQIECAIEAMKIVLAREEQERIAEK